MGESLRPRDLDTAFSKVSDYAHVGVCLGHSLQLWAVPNPLGVVAVLSAFNFPVAVYGW